MDNRQEKLQCHKGDRECTAITEKEVIARLRKKQKKHSATKHFMELNLQPLFARRPAPSNNEQRSLNFNACVFGKEGAVIIPACTSITFIEGVAVREERRKAWQAARSVSSIRPTRSKSTSKNGEPGIKGLKSSVFG